MDLNDLSMEFFGARRSEETARTRTTTTVLARAVSDSEGGRVLLEVDGTTTTAEDAEGNQYGSTIVEVPTSPSVREGDVAIVTLSGGKEKSPVVTGVIGSGDRQQQQIDSAYTDDSTYYLLSSTVPATPTDDTWEDAGWSTSEPIIGQEETRTLYVSRRVELVDGTVTWSIPAKVVTSASLDVMRNAILSTVSETYTTKTEFAESSDTASGSGRTVATEDAAGLELINLTVYGESVQDGTPTPDAPVEIRTVSGVNKISLTPYRVGGDFYNKAVGFQFVAQASDSAVTLEVSDGNVTMTSTATWRGLVFVSDRLTVGESYFILYEGGEVPGGQIGRTFYTLDSSFKVVRNLGNNTNNPNSVTSASITIANGEAYIAMGIGVRGSTGTLTFSNLSVISALLTASYVPYGSIGVEAFGKNLATVESVSSANISNLSRNLEAGTYTISLNCDSTAGGLNVRVTGETKNYASFYFSSSTVGTRFKKTFTIDHEGTLSFNGYSMNAYPYQIQLEKGTEATAYEPYRESISYIPLQGHSLASLPDGTRDVLHVEQGRAWIEKNVGSAVIDGSNVKAIGVTQYNPNGRFNVSLPGQQTVGAGDVRLNCYVDRLVVSTLPVNNPSLNDAAYTYELYSSFSFAVLPYNALSASTVAAANGWFAANPVTVVYPLATHETIDLGEVSLPTVQDGDTVRIIADVTPEFDTSWWRDTDIVGRTADVQSEAATAAKNAQNTADTANSKADTLTESVTTLTQRADGITASVESMQQNYDGTIQDIKASMSFDLNGLTIGRSDSKMKSNFSNASMTFSADGQEVMKLDGESSTASADRFQVGGWRLYKADGGKTLVLDYFG